MLKMEKLINKHGNETFVIDKGDMGDIEVRHRIDGATQETFAATVAEAILNKDGYFPLRKAPLMTYLFVVGFVIDGEKILVTDEAGEVDLYETHRVLEEHLHLMNDARAMSGSVDAILTRIEAAVDLLVSREEGKMNAIISAGMTSEVGKILLHVDSMTFDLAMAAGEIRKFITAENFEKLMNTMQGLQTVFAGRQTVGA